MDATDPHIALHRRVVEGVIEDLGLSKLPVLVVFNKIDALTAEQRERIDLEGEGIRVSALRRTGLDDLMGKIEGAMWRQGRGDLRPEWVRKAESWAAEAEEEVGPVVAG